MKLDHLPALDERGLTQLEANARRLQDSARDNEAREVLAAIVTERARRAETRRLEETQAADGIRQRMEGKTLHERVVAAFSERPPLDWELAMLRALHAEPGSSTETLSEALGFSGLYMNWFGNVCADRQAWLGQASPTPGSRGEIIYSALLVDFGSDEDAPGVTTWRLKPEAARALVELGLVKE